MEQLTIADLDFVLESLSWTKKKIYDEKPIGEPKGYSSYEEKQEALKRVSLVIEKIKQLQRDLL
jgi:hypothetical protein